MMIQIQIQNTNTFEAIKQPLTLGKYNNAAVVEIELRNTSISQHNTNTN